MTGIDTIKERILSEAKAEADGKLREAKAQADEIIGAARAEADKTKAGIEQSATTKLTNLKDRIDSSVDLQKRNMILAVKQELIAEVLDKAKAAAASSEAGEYFDLLLKLCAKAVRKGDGQLRLSAADLGRVPQDFEEAVKETAVRAGGTLTLSKEPADMTNGFIITYGGVEENCTFDAIFAERANEFKDLVQNILFD